MILFLKFFLKALWLLKNRPIIPALKLSFNAAKLAKVHQRVKKALKNNEIKPPKGRALDSLGRLYNIRRVRGESDKSLRNKIFKEAKNA